MTGLRRARRLRASAPLLVATLPLILSACHLHGRAHTDVGPHMAALRSAFNADVGHPRILLLLSPTCEYSLQGGSEIERVMRGNHDPDLRTLVVWVPKHGAKEKNVREATGVLPDKRARHFWDDHGAAAQAFSTPLDLMCSAWDVYLIYGPHARWAAGQEPPAPRFWMQQVTKHDASCGGANAVKMLDPTIFATHLAEVAPPAAPATAHKARASR